MLVCYTAKARNEPVTACTMADLIDLPSGNVARWLRELTAKKFLTSASREDGLGETYQISRKGSALVEDLLI